MIKPFKLIIGGRYLILLVLALQQTTYWLKIPTYNSIAGLAYKDAANWELCTKSLSMFGNFPSNISDWCLRRPVNIEFLAIILRLVGSMAFVYFILGILFSISLYWSYTHFRKILSLRQSNLLILVVLGIWFTFCNNMVLSESLALILGNLGLGYASKIFNNIRISELMLFSIVLTLIQIIRPGNLISPFLLLLLIPSTKLTSKMKIAFATVIFLIPLIYPLFIKFFTKIFYYQQYLTGGNAWPSFYGLVNNNISWQEAYASVPKNIGSSEIVINQYMKNQSISDFLNNPFQLLISIWQNIIYMFGKTFPFFSPVSFNIPSVLVPVALSINLFAIIYIYRRLYRNFISFHPKLFILIFLFFTILFYSLTWKSEPARSLSSTLPLSILMILYIFRAKNPLPTSELLESIKPIKFYISLFLIPLIFIGSIISINRISNKNLTLNNHAMYCHMDDFVFAKDTILIVDLKNVKKFQAFSWSSLIDTLPNGYLIQGIVIIKNKPIAITGYLASQKALKKDYIVSSCFQVDAESLKYSALQDLNFISLSLIT